MTFEKAIPFIEAEQESLVTRWETFTGKKAEKIN